MKSRIISRALSVGIAAALALSITGTAAAQQTLSVVHVYAAPISPIKLLAQVSGLTPRQVQMVLGTPTAFAGYAASYDFADRRFRRAVGPEIYQHLKTQGELSAQDVQNLTAMVNAQQTDRVASK